MQRETLARSGRQGAAEPKSTNGCSDTVRKSGKEGRVDAKVIKVAVGSVEPVKRIEKGMETAGQVGGDA